MKDKIKLSSDDKYAVARLCAILKLRHIDNIDSIIKDLMDVWDDVTCDTHKNAILLRNNMSYSKYLGYSNIEMTELLVASLREYLPIADITIIEQRLPLDQVRYELKES